MSQQEKVVVTARRACRTIEGVSPEGDASQFESLLALSFTEGLAEAFHG